MFVTAWNNGQHLSSGAGYGLKITPVNRDRYFKKEWQSVILELEGHLNPIEVNIAKPSFWGDTCRELIKIEIGKWLMKNDLAPWKKGKAPKLLLEPLGRNRFRLRKIRV